MDNEHPNPASDQPKDEQLEKNRAVLKNSAFRLLISAWEYVKQVMNIRDGVDPEGTTAGIKRDIDFKGHNVWILIASIIIASIGLNVNSAAAIIGAMLISPLMGPILGMGLAIGTNDFTTFKRSLRSFTTAVVVSIVTSTVYFWISPISEAQSELLARTTPTILDVLIAIFGGLAGIIAGSRKEKTNVIPGVAIATALMPPLCTAGYGIATGQLTYFLGAFYLFLLNSIFICVATYVVIRYLGFPKIEFVDPIRERKVKRYIVGFVLLVVVPSGYLFWGVIKESIFNTRAIQFVSENVTFDDVEIMNANYTYDEQSSGIELFLVSEHKIEDRVIQALENRMTNYGLENTTLTIHQLGNSSKEDFSSMTQELRVGVIEDMYERNERSMQFKDSLIKVLEKQLSFLQSDTIPFKNIKRELLVQHEELDGLSYGRLITSSKGVDDTIPTFILHWEETLDKKTRISRAETIEKWLRVRLNEPACKTINFTPFQE